jgi:hypothetical protein
MRWTDYLSYRLDTKGSSAFVTAHSANFSMNHVERRIYIFIRRFEITVSDIADHSAIIILIDTILNIFRGQHLLVPYFQDRTQL